MTGTLQIHSRAAKLVQGLPLLLHMTPARKQTPPRPLYPLPIACLPIRKGKLAAFLRHFHEVRRILIPVYNCINIKYDTHSCTRYMINYQTLISSNLLPKGECSPKKGPLLTSSVMFDFA